MKGIDNTQYVQIYNTNQLINPSNFSGILFNLNIFNNIILFELTLRILIIIFYIIQVPI
jgi:hypothetical protein